MTEGLRYLWHRHRLALLAFAGALAVTIFFLVRLVAFAIYWANPANHHRQPEGWMTARYIARSWGIPAEQLRTGLGLDPQGRPQTLESIATMRGVPLDEVLAEVRRLIEVERAAPASKTP